MPALAKEPTQAGAEAFVRYYWDLVNYAQATGDTKGLRSVSAETCEPCQGGIDALENIVNERGGKITGGEYSASNLRTTRLTGQVPSYRIVFALSNEKQTIDFPSGEKDGGFGASTNETMMALNFLDGAWVVAVFGDEK